MRGIANAATGLSWRIGIHRFFTSQKQESKVFQAQQDPVCLTDVEASKLAATICINHL